MIKKMNCFMIIFFALSSFFIVYGSSFQTAEAKICPVGQAPVWNGTSFGDCQGTETDEDSTNIKGTREYFGYTAIAIAALSLGISVLMVAYAGFLYTVSEGDAEKVRKAKFHIITAGGGMIISGLSFVIYGIFKAILT